ncbi:MAG TPA: hypothetical protein VK171_00085 [Fimbriimonas sp.]|nr:hypothetical protein [Fimbriimonas sp.]
MNYFSGLQIGVAASIFAMSGAALAQRETPADVLSTSNRVLNWRINTKADFQLQMGTRPSVTATAVVWAFGVPKDGPKSASRSQRPSDSNQIKAKVGRIVHVANLGKLQGSSKFTLNFDDFAPRAGNIVTFQVTPPSNLSPEQQILANAAKAQAAQNKKDALSEISADGTVRYYVQVSTEDGGRSNAIPIEFGEPKPNGTTNLEYLSIPGTQEFPNEVWSTGSSVSPQVGFSSFRWSTTGKPAKARVQVIDGLPPSSWALWSKAAPELYSGDVPVPSSGVVKFTLPSTQFLSKAKSDTVSIRVIPLTSSGDLAAMPSSLVTIGILKKPQTQPVDTSKTLKYDIQLIGWEPAYLGNHDDKYRFVVGGPVNPQIVGDVTKILGKTPQKGDKLYLPPAPPPKEEAWYEKVYKAIATVVDFVSSTADLVFANLIPMVTNVLKAGPSYIAEKAGVEPSTIKKAWAIAEAPLAVGNEVMSVPGYINKGKDAFVGRMLDDMGIKDFKTRAIMHGNLKGAVSSWASQNSYLTATQGPMQGLAPDPDFQVHTAIAYVRVRSSKLTGMPSDFRQPGPNIELKVGAFSGEAESIGVSLEYFDLFNATTKGPSMGSDEEIVLAIPMKYHWTHEQKNKDWTWGITRAQKTRYTLNGNAFFGNHLNTKWGKTVN